MNARTFIGPLGVSLVAIVVCIAAVAAQLPPLAGALLSPAAEQANPSARIDELVAKHEAQAETFQKRFHGRSAFFQPERPVIPRQVSSEQRDPPPPTLREAPAQYGGGLVPVSSLGDTIYVKQGGGGEVEVRVGEELAGTRIIEHNPPWSVTVAWTSPPEGEANHISYKEGVYTLSFWNDSEAGENAPFLKTPPPPGSRDEAMEAIGAEAELMDPGGENVQSRREELMRVREEQQRRRGDREERYDDEGGDDDDDDEDEDD